MFFTIAAIGTVNLAAKFCQCTRVALLKVAYGTWRNFGFPGGNGRKQSHRKTFEKRSGHQDRTPGTIRRSSFTR